MSNVGNEPRKGLRIRVHKRIVVDNWVAVLFLLCVLSFLVLIGVAIGLKIAS